MLIQNKFRYGEAELDQLRARIKALEQELEALKTRLAEMITHNFRPGQ